MNSQKFLNIIFSEFLKINKIEQNIEDFKRKYWDKINQFSEGEIWIFSFEFIDNGSSLIIELSSVSLSSTLNKYIWYITESSSESNSSFIN